MFTQSLDPLGNLAVTFLVALIPVALLLVLLAVFRITAWLAVLIVHKCPRGCGESETVQTNSITAAVTRGE